MTIYEEFIDQNKPYFDSCFLEASKNTFYVMGFSISSPHEAFKALIQNKDMYYLPYCLYLIQFGLGVSENEHFAMAACESLLTGQNSEPRSPDLAYVYAYFQNRRGDLNLSEMILQKLSEDAYAPALVTRGDLAWMRNDLKLSKHYYEQASDLGHFVAKIRFIKLFLKGSNFLLRTKIGLRQAIKVTRHQARGEKHIYLDFYGFKVSDVSAHGTDLGLG